MLNREDYDREKMIQDKDFKSDLILLHLLMRRTQYRIGKLARTGLVQLDSKKMYEAAEPLRQNRMVNQQLPH